jgi:hypothetical protein
VSDFESSNERALARNADKIAAKLEARRKALTAGLEQITDFNPERLEDGDPNALLREYNGAAHAGLKKILAEAAAREAAAKAREK